MTKAERQAESICKDIEKLQNRLDAHRARLEKKIAKAEKLDALEYKDEWDITENGYRTGDNLKGFSAWFDVCCETREVKEIEKSLEHAKGKLNKVLPIIEDAKADKIEEERMEKMENSFFQMSQKSREEEEAEFQAWLEKFKAECLQDGVIIEDYSGWWISGKTASGKNFALYGNSGFTDRSRHCYTLYIGKTMMFTSGEFATAYRILKK